MLINYLYFNPSGNMTALVTSAVPFNMRKSIADEIMKTEPGCEQVGFVSFDGGVFLDMTGGEFCGNATMCAAIAAVLKGKCSDALLDSETLSVKICGTSYEIVVKQISAKKFECTLYADDVPEGIIHSVIESEPDKARAEEELRYNFENYLMAEKRSAYSPETDARGFMFLNGNNLLPLVYVPGADTFFWENSCASGSMAVGRYLFEKTGCAADCDLKMPGGTIRVQCDENGIKISERIELISETSLYIDIR